MKNSVEKNSETNAPKELYVKPAMEVIEMEVEGFVMADSGLDGGRYGQSMQTPFDNAAGNWGMINPEEKA